MNDSNDSNEHKDLADVEETLPPEKSASQDLDPKMKTKRPWWQRFLIFLAFAIFFFIVLLVGAGVVLTYYFPSERIKPIVEKELTGILKIPVSIDSLDLSLLHGLNVSRLTLGKEKPLLSVQNIVLEYDLTQLMQGRFIINEVNVNQPELNLVSVAGVWNFQPLLELGKPAEPTKKPFELPTLPIAVNLKEFVIRNIQVNLDMDGEIKSRLQGLSVEARGKLDREEIDIWLRMTLVQPSKGQHNLEFFSSQGKGIDVKTLGLMNVEVSAQDLNNIRLKGQLDLENNQIQIGDPLPVPNISAEIDMNATVKDQGVKIQKLALFLTEENRIELSGEADQLASNPRFSIRLNDAAFNIGDLIKWAGAMIPPVEASGKVRVTGLEVKGNLPDFKPGDIEVVNAHVDIIDFSAKHAPLSAMLEGVDVNIDLGNAKLINGIPENLEGTIRLKMDRGRAQNLSVKGLNHDLRINAKGSNLAEVALTFSTALKEVRFSPPQMEPIKTSLNVEGSAEANWNSGDIHSFKVNYSLGPVAQGKLKGRARNLGKTSFKVEQDIDIKLKALRSLIPKNIFQKIGGFPSAGDTSVHAVIQGRLDQNFQPVQALLNTKINLKGIDVQLNNPPVEAKQVSATISFLADYIAAKGIKIPRLDVTSRFEKVKVLGKLELGATEINTRLTMGNYYPLTGEPGKIPITNKTSIKLDRVQSSAPEIVLTGLTVDTSLKSDLYPNDIKNLALQGNVSILDVEGVKEVKTGKIQTSFDVNLNDLSLTEIRTSVDVKVDPPSPEKLEGKIPIGPITFTSQSRQNLKTGDIEIENVSLTAPSLVNLSLKGKLKNWGKTFAVESKITETQLAALWEKVPQALRAGMEDLKVAGSVDLSLNARGSIPEKFDLNKTSLPIVAKASFGLEDASLSWPSKGITVDNMNTSTVVDFKEGTGEVSGKISLGKLFLKNVLGDDWLDPEFGFKYSLRDFNKFTLEEHVFSIKKYGIRHSISGSVDGLKPFLTGKIPLQPDEISRRLDISLTAKNQLDFQKAINEGTRQFLKGIQATGALHANLDLKMAHGETVKIDGNVEFDQFNAKIPDVVKVTGLNGRFPFNKTLFLKRVLVKTLKDSFLASRKGFFTQLRDFSKYKNNFTVKEIEVANQRISNISLDLLFKNNRFMAEKFLFDVLDGSVAGNLFVIPTPEGPELNFSTEFAGLNFGALVGRSKETEESESEIDGNMQMGLKVKQGLESEPISIDQIYTKIAITRIGAETLDRVLLFLDPEESKPAIVDIRAKLKLASPHRILITVENGNLNVEAWLKNKILGDIIKAPELKRVPITSLKQFRDVTDQLKTLTGLRDALKYLAARGIEFTEEGEILLY